MIDDVDVRALAVLLRPSRALLLAALALIAWAGYLVVVAPDDLRGPYIVLLLYQSFAASTGYAQRARRGHFDQLLAGRRSRRHFAMTHAWMSAALGAAAWVAVSMLDALGHGGHWPLGFTPQAIVAFAYLSTVAWTISVPFSRYAGGVLWLIVTVALAASGRLLALRNYYVTAADTWTGVWHAVGPALLFPPVVVGELSRPSLGVMAIAIAAALLALAAGVVFVAQYNLALEDAE